VKKVKNYPAKSGIVKSLSPLALRRIYNPKNFKFKSTEEVADLKRMIGQDRAVCSLVFGLEIKSHGFNIYALGPTGTGKTIAILKYLEQESKKKPIPSDWLYINNFIDNDKPRKLELPAGKGD
jgi:Cdc6-like AAA superfamily ATPase